mmetsp:Transcript_41985/g.75376  ORF Transcript_41985/g.75376 Transcript_41985/m.75376 type:complete len:222 (+) Transcript_41985:841-1506(+)
MPHIGLSCISSSTNASVAWRQPGRISPRSAPARCARSSALPTAGGPERGWWEGRAGGQRPTSPLGTIGDSGASSCRPAVERVHWTQCSMARPSKRTDGMKVTFPCMLACLASHSRRDVLNTPATAPSRFHTVALTCVSPSPSVRTRCTLANRRRPVWMTARTTDARLGKKPLSAAAWRAASISRFHSIGRVVIASASGWERRCCGCALVKFGICPNSSAEL